MKQRFGRIAAAGAPPQDLFHVGWAQSPHRTFPVLVSDGGEVFDAFVGKTEHGRVSLGPRVLTLKDMDFELLKTEGQADIGVFQITLYHGWSWDRWREHCFFR